MKSHKKTYRKHKAEYGSYEIHIEENLPEVECSLKVYKNGKQIADHFLDSLYLAKQQAYKDYGILPNSWPTLEN